MKVEDEGHCCDTKQSRKVKIWCYRYRNDDQLYLSAPTNFGMKAVKVSFCPFCGYSCQPERLRRVDAEKRSDSLNSTNE